MIKRFVSVEFNRFLSYYKDAPDLNVRVHKRDDKRRDEKGRDSRRRDDNRGRESRNRSNENFTRFHINLGSKNNVSAIDLISLINENTGNNSIEIGKIEILKAFSFFEIDKSYEKKVLEAFRDVDRDGTKVKIEVSKNREKPDMSKRFKKKRPRSGKRRFS